MKSRERIREEPDGKPFMSDVLKGDRSVAQFWADLLAVYIVGGLDGLIEDYNNAFGTTEATGQNLEVLIELMILRSEAGCGGADKAQGARFIDACKLIDKRLNDIQEINRQAQYDALWQAHIQKRRAS